jgi:anti-anti-sigma factor
MDITEERQGNALVIAPAGRVDMQSAEALRSYLLPRVDACARAGEPVVLDFANVDYISSAGLRVLMLGAKAAKSAGGTLSVARLQPVVREVFEISRFDKILACFQDVTEAVATAARRGP